MELFFENLVKVVELINIGSSVEETLDFVFNSFKEYIPYNRIGIALLDNNNNIHAQAACSDNKASLKAGYCTGLSDTSLESVINSKEPRIIGDYVEYLNVRPDSEHTRLMIEEGIRSSIACPLTSNNACIGVIFFSCKHSNTYNEKHISLAKMIAAHMGIAIEKNILVDDLILASITGFAKLVEAKDSDTGMHIERMQNYSRILAKGLSKSAKYKDIVNDRFVMGIYNFSPLHDIGKVGIPDRILLKPGKLTEEEFEIMKRHSLIGADVLIKASSNLQRKGRSIFDMGIQIALGHHEKYNGRGYPYGLEGESIPLPARIVAVADVLDAISSKRVYKEAYSFDASIKIISDESGISFDPDVVEALLENRDEMLEVYMCYGEGCHTLAI